MLKRRSLAASVALAMACGVAGHTTAAMAYDMSCLPPIDDCQYKWFAEPWIQNPGSEGTEMHGSGGTTGFTWRKVPINFNGYMAPLDADSYQPCENKGNDGVNGLGYSGGGGG